MYGPTASTFSKLLELIFETREEAISWGKLTAEGEHVKVFADATIVFPILVAESFAKK